MLAAIGGHSRPSNRETSEEAESLGNGVTGTRLGVVSSCVHAAQVLQEQADRAGVTLHAHLNLTTNTAFTHKVTSFITSHLVSPLFNYY